MNVWFSPLHVAGYLAVVIGAIDHWAFHDAFGLQWDQGLILAGLGWLGGVTVQPIVAQMTSRLRPPS